MKEAGEAGATLFWERLAPLKDRLYGYIRKTLVFAPEADDVYQETVLRGCRYFASFRRDGDFAAWIFGIAHNEIRSHWRGSRRRRTMAGLEEAAAEPAASDERVREVFRFAARLAPRDRDVFFLYYESGFSVAEIARLARLKEGHVKWILHQSRESLKAVLGVCHDDK